MFKNSQLFLSISDTELTRKVDELNDSYKAATTVEEIQQLIDEIDNATTKIDHELNHFVTLKLKKHQKEITNIELNRASKLSSTITTSNELVNIFLNANDLGHSLTFKIKSLEEEIGNVDKTLEFVNDIQLLRNNINQANYAIEHSNWEVAAQCIYKVTSKLSPELIDGKFSSAVIPSTDIPELPHITIQGWREKLTEVFKMKFNEASKERNVGELTKYFQLFPLINQEEVGLNCYSKFICQIINDTLRTLIGSTNSMQRDSKPGIFSNITIQLFESISMMLAQHGPLIKKYYAATYPNAINLVITKIQHEIDSQVGIIGDTFYDTRRIDKLFQDVNLYRFPILTRRNQEVTNQIVDDGEHPEDDDLISIVEVGDYINELGTIFHHWSLYCKFITIKYLNVTNEETLKLPQIIIDSNFTKKIHTKYLPAFETLYSFYLRRSLEKAIVIEELPSLDSYLGYHSQKNILILEQVPCSSVIEDVTLILNTTIRNVIDSSILSTVKHFVTSAFQVIQRDLVNGFFIKLLNENQPKYNQSLSLVSAVPNGLLNGVASPHESSRSNTPDPSPGMGFFKGASSALGNVVGGTAAAASTLSGLNTVPNPPKLMNFIIYLNTVAMGQEYFSKIFENLLRKDNYLKSTFPFGKDNEKVELILRVEFLDPFNSITNKIISDSLVNLYNQSLKTRLLIMISDFFPEINDSNYVVYSSNLLSDTSLMLKFTSGWQSLITPYKRTLHRSLIFNKLLRLLVINLANIIEKKLHMVLKKFRINELGSIKLEKDLSYFINEVCEDNYQLREKFVRVTQFVLLVGMDDEEYDESMQHANQRVEEVGKPKEGDSQEEYDEYEDQDFIGINWVLTPQERKQIRSYRV